MVRPISNPVSADASSWISLIDATQRFGIDVNLVGKLEAGEHEKNRLNNSTYLTQQPERCENNDPIFVMHDAAISMATCSCCCCMLLLSPQIWQARNEVSDTDQLAMKFLTLEGCRSAAGRDSFIVSTADTLFLHRRLMRIGLGSIRSQSYYEATSLPPTVLHSICFPLCRLCQTLSCVSVGDSFTILLSTHCSLIAGWAEINESNDLNGREKLNVRTFFYSI